MITLLSDLILIRGNYIYLKFRNSFPNFKVFRSCNYESWDELYDNKKGIPRNTLHTKDFNDVHIGNNYNKCRKHSSEKGIVTAKIKTSYEDVQMYKIEGYKDAIKFPLNPDFYKIDLSETETWKPILKKPVYKNSRIKLLWDVHRDKYPDHYIVYFWDNASPNDNNYYDYYKQGSIARAYAGKSKSWIHSDSNFIKPNNTISYTIVAVWDHKTKESNVRSITIPKKKSAVMGPSHLKIKQYKGNLIKLSWSITKKSESESYLIYRKFPSDYNFQQIGETFHNEFIDDLSNEEFFGEKVQYYIASYKPSRENVLTTGIKTINVKRCIPLESPKDVHVDCQIITSTKINLNKYGKIVNEELDDMSLLKELGICGSDFKPFNGISKSTKVTISSGNRKALPITRLDTRKLVLISNHSGPSVFIGDNSVDQNTGILLESGDIMKIHLGDCDLYAYNNESSDADIRILELS